MSKKFISLFLAFSILTLSIPLTAKEKKGANLIIQKKDETQVRGELIAVKEDSLLLKERDSGADVTIDINGINAIKIINKSRTVLGVGLGIVIGGAAGMLAGYEGSKVFWQFEERKAWTLVGGALGMVLGWTIGAAFSGPKTIQFEAKSDSELQEILEELRKKARIRNYQ